MYKMKISSRKKLKNYIKLSVLVILLGVLLIIYMMRVEDELGALPLLLILSGTVWFVVNKIAIKKLLQSFTQEK